MSKAGDRRRLFAVIVGGAGLIAFALYATKPIEVGDPFRPDRVCRYRLQALASALDLYAQDHAGRLPATDWCDSAMSRIKFGRHTFTCSLVEQAGKEHGFALNTAVMGRDLASLSADTVILFETGALGWNVVASLVAESVRHGKGTPRVLAKQFASHYPEVKKSSKPR